MWLKTSSILISFVVIAISGGFCLAGCPSADLTGDCFVDFEDFGVMAAQWLTTDPCIPNDMAIIPSGEFAMGNSFSEGNSDERPVHTVTVDLFYMGKCEITNQQYCDYLNSALAQGLITVIDGVVYQAGSGTSYSYCDTRSASIYSQIDCNDVTGIFIVRTKSGRDMSNDPMVHVSWYGAAAYCNWRSQQEGYEQCYSLSTWDCDFGKKGYRLPTEAEWEYAARGGLSGRRFQWGDTISHTQANYYSYWDQGAPYYPYDTSTTEGYHPAWDDGVVPYTSPVGSFAANGYGLYDMAGNVWELCNDWYSDFYYSSSPADNPTGPTTGTGYVVRGGNGSNNAYCCRVAYRLNYYAPTSRYDSIGFRLVLGS